MLSTRARVAIASSGGITRVYFDGEEVNGIASANVNFEVDSLPAVTLRFLPGFVNVDIDEADITVALGDEDLLQRPIDFMGLSVRSHNALKVGRLKDVVGFEYARINTVGEVVEAYKNGTLKRYRNLGKKGQEEVVTKLKELKLI